MATTPAPRPGPQAPQGSVPAFSEARVKELTALAEYLMGKVDFSRGLIGENQHPYCRGKDIVDFMVSDGSAKVGLDKVTTEAEARALFEEMLLLPKPVLVRRVDLAMETPAGSDKPRKVRRNNMCVLKEHAGVATRLKLEDEGRYVWLYEGSSTWMVLKLLGVIGLVFAVLLYRLWPWWLQTAVWYVAVTFLLLLVGMLVLRLSLFLLFWVFGCEFWLFPRFFEDIEPWLIFTPVVSFRYEGGQWIYRVLLLGLLGAAAYWASQQPTQFDEFIASQRSFVADLYEGKLLAAGPVPGQPDPTDSGAAAARKLSLEELQRRFEEEEAAEQLARKLVESEVLASGDAVEGTGAASSAGAATAGDLDDAADGASEDTDMMAELRAQFKQAEDAIGRE